LISDIEKCPGPDSYNWDDNFVRMRAPSFTMSGSEHHVPKWNFPASSYPGNIQKNYVLFHSPEYTFGHAFKPLKRDKSAEYLDLSGYNPFKEAPKHSFGLRFSDIPWVYYLMDTGKIEKHHFNF
jgi:hypothetical protein